MSKKTLGLVLGLIILTIALLAVASRPATNKPASTPSQNVTVTTTPIPPVYTLISLSPNPVTVKNTGGDVEVMVDTKTNSITGFQLELSYDPKVLKNMKLTPGEFLADATTLINTNDPKTGRATYALAITPNQNPAQGQGVLAHIHFDVIPGATGPTNIELTPESAVTQQGVSTSVLKKATGTTVMIGTSQNTPARQVTLPVQTQISPVQ